MSAIEVAEQRPKPTDLSKVGDADRAALFSRRCSRTRERFRSTARWSPTTSTSPGTTTGPGPDQVRNVRLEGNMLYITTNVQPSAIDGKPSIGILTWEKVE
jgi:hypothetical protein